MGTNDKRKNFIDDDIFDDNIEEKINELYEKTRQIQEINKNTPETDNEILKNINTYFSEIGIWDNTIDVFVETESYRKLEDEKNKEKIEKVSDKDVVEMIKDALDKRKERMKVKNKMIKKTIKVSDFFKKIFERK